MPKDYEQKRAAQEARLKQAESQPDRPILRTSDVAYLLGFSVSWVGAIRDQLPHLRVGANRRYTWNAVRAFRTANGDTYKASPGPKAVAEEAESLRRTVRARLVLAIADEMGVTPDDLADELDSLNESLSRRPRKRPTGVDPMRAQKQVEASSARTVRVQSLRLARAEQNPLSPILYGKDVAHLLGLTTEWVLANEAAIKPTQVGNERRYTLQQVRDYKARFFTAQKSA